MKNSNFLSKQPNHTIIIILIFCLILGTFTGIAITVNLVKKHAKLSFKNLIQKDLKSSKEKLEEFRTIAQKNKDIFLAKLTKNLSLTDEQKEQIKDVINTQKEKMVSIKENLRMEFSKAKTNIYKILNKEQRTKLEKK